MNQNQQKIQNPETAIPTSPEMNERDFMTDMLATEKYMTASYTTYLNEASSDHLYQDISQIFNESQDCQRNLYNAMFKHGWYGLDPADQQTMQQSYQQFTGYKNQLPYPH
ncbi:hypothetical protein N781_13140 [Pontibacillus halophilus JSM 076056 = DSM 19796]|uniref:Spore coat protein n=1 Tax=Pontibacillus halophilus JSM 076056 = DSM 19796 TaxID=1385510 RepID=A0A0A5GHV1_9BACI|nr:spore coat protein [Pontibacillus halophilus]KGX92836.1 hypothetical protein N781_13140 [Pontibacillus halophilus JSM 076056 = DSM 19796]